MKYSKSECQELYTRGNDDGLGFAPTCASTEDAVTAALADGWTLVYAAQNSDELDVLEDDDGEVLAIGDAHGAWAVMISEVIGA